jgi:phosphoribosylformylglycinamidine cyclo-ligase
MPSVYAPGDFDLAGFAVGAVERKQIVDGSAVRPGDVLIGLSSSGLHSNGYSLARKVLFERMKKRVTSRIPEWGTTVAEELLRPTRIYVRPVLSLARKIRIRGMANITGGGITGNLPRVLPRGTMAIVEKGTWAIPPVFSTLVAAARLAEDEAYRTFNMGIGMTLMVRPGDANLTLRHFRKAGIPAFAIGEVRKGSHGRPAVRLTGGKR